MLISNKMGHLKELDGKKHEIKDTYHSASSVLYDALLLVKTDAIEASQMPKFER